MLCKSYIKRLAQFLFMLELALDRGYSLVNGNDSFNFSRKELKREARNNLKHHYLMYVVACLFALIMQAEFLTSDNLIGVRRQVIDDATSAVFELYEDPDLRRIEHAYRTIDEDADSMYTGVEQALYSKTFENEHTNEIFGRTR